MITKDQSVDVPLWMGERKNRVQGSQANALVLNTPHPPYLRPPVPIPALCNATDSGYHPL